MIFENDDHRKWESLKNEKDACMLKISDFSKLKKYDDDDNQDE